MATASNAKAVTSDDNVAQGREYRLAKMLLTAVNFFVETNRLEPYAAVYLVEIKGWDPLNFGVVSLVMNLTSE